jgi:hypothetical protein
MNLCLHIKTNGERCGSPALRGETHCYFHHQQRRRIARPQPAAPDPAQSDNGPIPGLEIPVLEDANAIQVALMEIISAIVDGRLTNRRAGLLLYALQIACINLPRVRLKPFEAVDSVPADPTAAIPPRSVQADSCDGEAQGQSA